MQVYLHYIKKSTEGWSIYSVMLDFCGGIFSFLQMGVDAINNGKITSCTKVFITSLAKEVMFLVALVSLSVDNITQKVMNGSG